MRAVEKKGKMRYIAIPYNNAMVYRQRWLSKSALWAFATIWRLFMELLDAFFYALYKAASNFNDFLWSRALIVLLIGCGLFFTLKTKFVQFRLVKDMFKLLGESAEAETACGKKKGKAKGVSSFQAFAISVASRVGTGNLAGVAIAISLGGPGAIFWMWLMAVIGAASSFVESALAQVYKVKDGSHFRGGPAYYMRQGLNSPVLGAFFAVLITVTFGFVFNMVQSNTIAMAFSEAFNVPPLASAIAVAFLTAIVVFGGVKRIAAVSSIVVPVMAVSYVLIALFVIVKNYTLVPAIFKQILSEAFNIKSSFSGSIVGVALQGIKRGLFSNEAGMGSAPNAAAAAHTSHPAKQGLLQALSVFTDTLVICSCTAFIILASGVPMNHEDGIVLTQRALSSQMGAAGPIFIAFSLFCFAYSSIIGNYYYGETNVEFLNKSKKSMFVYRLLVVSLVFVGALQRMAVVWNLADLFMGLMAIVNLYAIVRLAPVAVYTLADYEKQKKKKKNPVFNQSSVAGLETDCWEPLPAAPVKA